MKELLIYLLSISTFVKGGEYCEILNPIAYTNNINTEIVICDRKRTTKKVIIHELGHIYQFQMMSKQERKEWEELYNSSILLTGPLWKRNFVNIEAMKNQYEMFAETFTYIRYHNDNNKATLFIKKLIGKTTQKFD